MPVSTKESPLKSTDKKQAEPALKVVKRALDVLEHLANHSGRAVDVSKKLGLRWATLHRTLSELETGGFLQKAPNTNEYSIGQKAWLIGSRYLENHSVLHTARPYLDDVTFDGSLTVQLAEKAGRHSMALFTKDIGSETIKKATLGFNFPLHCGSKGHVLLAFSAPEVIDEYLQHPLEKLTANTTTEPAILKEQLALVRKQGYSMTVSDVQPHTSSIAAPVFDKTNQLVATVTFIIRKSLLREREDSLLEKLLETSQSISIGLGWQPQFND